MTKFRKMWPEGNQNKESKGVIKHSEGGGRVVLMTPREEDDYNPKGFTIDDFLPADGVKITEDEYKADLEILNTWLGLGMDKGRYDSFKEKLEKAFKKTKDEE